jgi:hypothetical protein
MKRVLVPMLLASAVLLVPQTYAQSCCEPTVKDFPKVGGNLGNQNYSSLAQVNKGNITRGWLDKGVPTGHGRRRIRRSLHRDNPRQSFRRRWKDRRDQVDLQPGLRDPTSPRSRGGRRESVHQHGGPLGGCA